MKLNFYKYEGAGNDFILLDNRELQFNPDQQSQMIKKLCDRHFGIGADGLMALQLKPGYHFEMLYYNASGSAGTMCGNGGRCITAFAKRLGIIQNETNFMAVDGPHYAKISENGDWVSLKMIDVDDIKMDGNAFVLNTGSPHYVTMANDVMHIDVFKKGRDIRYSNEFKNEGINVNFVQQTEEPDKIIVRTYERGVEDETYSCGTGVTASALVCYHNDNGFNRVEVQTKGGELSVEYDRIGESFKNVWLNGPAVKVFEGDIEIADAN